MCRSHENLHQIIVKTLILMIFKDEMNRASNIMTKLGEYTVDQSAKTPSYKKAPTPTTLYLM